MDHNLRLGCGCPTPGLFGVSLGLMPIFGIDDPDPRVAQILYPIRGHGKVVDLAAVFVSSRAVEFLQMSFALGLGKAQEPQETGHERRRAVAEGGKRRNLDGGVVGLGDLDVT